MKHHRILSYLIVTCFLLIPLFSVIPHYGSNDSEVANIELRKDFTLSSTYLEPGGRANAMVAYDSESDVAIVYGGWDDPDPWELDDTWAYSYNTNTWMNMSPSTFPSRREVGMMAYDSQSDKMVMFGGVTDYDNSVHTNETWTYSYNTNTWTKMSPATAPNPRIYAGMTYDSESDRIILFGGVWGINGYNDETWSYDVETNTWTEMSPPVSPSRRWSPAMAYDEESDRVILFGGRPHDYIVNYVMNDTWAYDFNTDTWEFINTVPHPVARRMQSMVYDSAADSMVLFGGSDEYDITLGDTWLFDYNSNNWTQQDPTNHPSARVRHGMIYDSESNVVLSFFGAGDTGDSSIIQNDLVWAYDTGNDHWRGMSPITQKGLVDTMMAYDSESDMSIIFGGMDFTYPQPIVGQTWSYDLNSDSYFDLSPVTAPSARAAGGITYDSQSDRIVQFGGILSLTSNLASGETWIYDYNSNNWTNPAPAIAPSARLGTYMTYDSGSDRVILFGGITLNPSTVIHNDTWAYDLETNTWEEMNPTSAPVARYGSAITYDSESDRVILFGGNPSATTTTGTFSDTWMYDYELDRWAEVSTTGHPPAGYTGKMAYDSESDKVVFFGGYPENSERNQTWILDLNANLWTQVSPDPHPDGRFRHHMVYDVESDAVVMFGGMTGDWFSEDSVNDTTWSYDVNSVAWTQMTALPGPTPTTTTTPSTIAPPPDYTTAALVAVVIITGLVIVVVVLKGVVFPKVELDSTG
ncbi:MAG: Kelch repeat-containing protein [Candidatus Thorarchaeota archaeon]